MRRRDFIQMAGMSAGAMMLPISAFANRVDPARFLDPLLDVQQTKALSDDALNIVKTESFGVGIRVIVNGTWGFAASNNVTADGMKKTTERAVAIAKANSKFQTEPVKLAPTQSYGEVSWKTPIKKNGFEVPVKDKVDLLLAANAKAL